MGAMILTAALVAALLRAALLWRAYDPPALGLALMALAGFGLLLFGIDAHLEPLVATALGLGALGVLAAGQPRPWLSTLGLLALAGQGAGLALAFWHRAEALAALGLTPGSITGAALLALLALMAAFLAFGRLGATGATPVLLALALGIALMAFALGLLPINPGHRLLLGGAALLFLATLSPGIGPVPPRGRPRAAAAGWLAFWFGQALILFGSLFYWYHPAA